MKQKLEIRMGNCFGVVPTPVILPLPGWGVCVGSGRGQPDTDGSSTSAVSFSQGRDRTLCVGVPARGPRLSRRGGTNPEGLGAAGCLTALAWRPGLDAQGPRERVSALVNLEATESL